MKQREHNKDEFNVFVLGSLESNPFMTPMLYKAEIISNETVDYLRKIGYNANFYIPPLGLGATGGSILATLAIVERLIPFLKVVILVMTAMANKYVLREINWSNRSKDHMHIDISYSSEATHWVKDWDPDNASRKLDTMIDAAQYASQYLNSKYPNIVFSSTISFKFKTGQSKQSYSIPAINSQFNIARIKRLFRYTTFEKNTSKYFTLVNKILVKRQDSFVDKVWYKGQDSSVQSSKYKTYYFIIPSMLISELSNKYELIKNKLKSKVR